jgi:hypothetical protein
MRRLVAASARVCACCLAGLLLLAACGPALARDPHDRISKLEATAASGRALRLNTDGHEVPWGTLVDTEVRTFKPDPRVCGGNPSETTKLPATAWQGVVVGARIQF